MKLTEKQEQMARRLSAQGQISWTDCAPQDTRCLNQLVKKGYAKNIMDTFWTPTEKAHELRSNAAPQPTGEPGTTGDWTDERSY